MSSLDPHAVAIYIDGSSYKNPGGRGGLAGLVQFPDSLGCGTETAFEIGYEETANNRMELLACIKAFEYIREHVASWGVERVIIVTDSLYLHRNYRNAPFWKRNGWKNTAGRPVENSDLWKQFSAAQTKTGIRTELVWRKGKTTQTLKAVDKLAKSAAGQPWEVDRGFRPGKVGRSKLGGRVASSLFPARGQQARVRVYRTGVVGRGHNKIIFEVYEDQTAQYVGKYSAYTSSQLAIELHRGHSFVLQFNNDLRHPSIEAIISRLGVVN